MTEPTSYQKKCISVSFLGKFSLTLGNNTITDEINRSQKIWNVLSYFIINNNRHITQSELIDKFWPNENSSNPINALKTLLYRIRAILSKLSDDHIDFIIAQRGSYSWNSNIQCEIDADIFESLCKKSFNKKLSLEKRMELYEKAIHLYKGDLLPRLYNQLWLIPLREHYHMIYLTAVKEYANLLAQTKQFDKMTDLCTNASQLDNLDEEIHILIIQSLLYQGKEAAALAHYDTTTDLLYRNLGVRPSEELQALYTNIMSVKKFLETDLEIIQHDLHETSERLGAFICEYGFFKEAYRLEARRASRNGTCVHIGLITVANHDGSIPPLKLLNHTMDQLEKVLITDLRRGDVVAKYSGAQYVLMLPSANYENSIIIMNRIISDFYHLHRGNVLKISYKIRELEIN